MSPSNTFMLGPIVAVLLLVPILVLGLVLFIVGLVKKKPAMWGSGIAIGVLGLLVLVVGAGMFMFVSVRKSTQMMAPAQAQLQALQVQARALGNTPALDFHTTTGLDLPDGVSITRTTVSFSASAGTDAKTETLVSICRMSVPVNFDEFLTANFKKAKWSTVAPTFQTALSDNASFLPSDTQLQAMSLYVLDFQTTSDSSITYTTAVAHDADKENAWMVTLMPFPDFKNPQFETTAPKPVTPESSE